MESAGHNLSHICFVGVEPSPPPPVWRRRPGRRRLPPNQAPRTGTETGAMVGAAPSPAQPAAPFFVWLLQTAGLEAGAYRTQALERRLSACLRVLRVASPEAAQARLSQHPELLPQALSAVLIGVSEFFRDPEVFERLHRSVLPELLQGRCGLRVYSAGCSAGQELYSLALLLSELGALPASSLLGVDCRGEAIAHAAAGCFAAAELAGVKPEWRERYFQIAGARAWIAPALRQPIQWRVENLLAASPAAAGWDVILFRNVAIYLQPDLNGLWERLIGQLRPGGVLVTGKAERPPASLCLKRVAPCIFLKPGK